MSTRPLTGSLFRMIDRIARGVRREPTPRRERLVFSDDPPVIYAIGDVHGSLELLTAVEEQIARDEPGHAGEKLIVMLGDYVDRGPKSAQVLDHLLTSPGPGLRRLCLAGNHEDAMLAFMRDPAANADWLGFGGIETLNSYGISLSSLDKSRLTRPRLPNLLASHIPPEHVTFLAGLPVLIETPSYIFTHAGLRAGVSVADQQDQDLMWGGGDISEAFEGFGKTVVHGHIQQTEALVTRSRIALDTGAYATGRLTAVRLASGQPPKILASNP